MEFCDKGNIYSFQATRDNGVVDFEECAYIIKSVLNGLTAIHSKNLIHRDIKAENILLISDTSKTEPYGYTVKICDLGFCREDDQNVNTFCGTTSYMAPEIFKKQIYDNKVDVWAVGVMLFRMLFGDFPFKGMNMQYQISSKCAKGFNIKKMKLKHNPSISKDSFEILSEIFSRIFRINPEERITVEELQKYKFFTPVKMCVASLSTEAESSDDEATFEADKIMFIESILQKVKSLKFLSHWEQVCFDYYIKKISLSLLEPFGQKECGKMKMKEMQQGVDRLGNYMAKNMKENNIPRLGDYFSHKASKFSDFKQSYRLVVGHVFSKAHKQIAENISLRSQIKLELFCCHLINRIFQKEYRREIFSHYFDWLRTVHREKKFSFVTFKEWIRNENSDKLVQTVELMNQKFYKKK